MLLAAPRQLLNWAGRKKKGKKKRKKKENQQTIQGLARNPAELLIMKRRPVLSKYKGTRHSFAEITTANEPPFSTAMLKLLWGSWKA